LQFEPLSDKMGTGVAIAVAVNRLSKVKFFVYIDITGEL